MFVRPSRLASLDGLRSAAALMVFVHHVQLPGLHPATVGFDAGVLVFFALSGFLIYRPFVAARGEGSRVDLRGYAIRRTLRILPAYLVAAVAIGVLFEPSALDDPIGILTMSRTPIIVAWTLQLEIVFYAVVPAAAWLLGRLPDARRVPALFATAIASVALTIAIMVLSIDTRGGVASTSLSTFPSMIWAFVPGLIVAELEADQKLGLIPRRSLFAAGIALIALSVIVDLPSYLDLAAAVGAGLLIAGLVSEGAAPIRMGGLVAIAGATSYSFYLWHEAIVDAIDRPPTWLGAGLALVVTVIVAAIVYAVVERPAIGVGRRVTTTIHSRRVRAAASLGRGVA